MQDSTSLVGSIIVPSGREDRTPFSEELWQGQLRQPTPQERISEMRPIHSYVGARLTPFWKIWADNVLIVNTIRRGYQIHFLYQPPTNFVETPWPWNTGQTNLGTS